MAAGRITSSYEWFEPFDDVEGWDLRHGRRVEWVKPVSPILVDGLARGTISRVFKGNPKNAAERLLNEGEGAPVEKKDIPPPANSISEEHLVGSLIENGLRPADAEAVIRAIWHVRRLAGWYLVHGRDLSEHEIRTFLIIPILLALGWSEQRIKIEWNHTDISLFSDVFKKGIKPVDPRVILESKRMRMGLEHAERQVQRYAKVFPDCNTLVTSSGARYDLYEKEPEQKWDASSMKEKHLTRESESVHPQGPSSVPCGCRRRARPPQEPHARLDALQQSASHPLIAIVGPTAAGKSGLALQLALRFEGEIVNGDSRLVYRHMDIGTAKPSQQELGLVPHHLVNIADPDDTYSLALYLDQASQAIRDIHGRSRLPFS